MIVRPTFFLFGASAEVIPEATWDRMERMFERERIRIGATDRSPDLPLSARVEEARRWYSGESPEKLFRCEACGKGFKTARALADHSADAHPSA